MLSDIWPWQSTCEILQPCWNSHEQQSVGGFELELCWIYFPCFKWFFQAFPIVGGYLGLGYGLQPESTRDFHVFCFLIWINIYIYIICIYAYLYVYIYISYTYLWRAHDMDLGTTAIPPTKMMALPQEVAQEGGWFLVTVYCKCFYSVCICMSL